MRIVPFKAEHLEQMKQPNVPNYMSPETAKTLEGDLSFTAEQDGVILMCFGVVELWFGRYIGWARVSPDSKGHWKSLHKATTTFCNVLNASRLELDIDPEFTESRRWAEHMGFKCEIERRKNYFPDGTDASLYARIGT